MEYGRQTFNINKEKVKKIKDQRKNSKAEAYGAVKKTKSRNVAWNSLFEALSAGQAF